MESVLCYRRVYGTRSCTSRKGKKEFIFHSSINNYYFILLFCELLFSCHYFSLVLAASLAAAYSSRVNRFIVAQLRC